MGMDDHSDSVPLPFKRMKINIVGKEGVGEVNKNRVEG